MKTRNIIYCLIALLAFSSCQDMFEPADENNRSDEALTGETKIAFGLLLSGYNSLPYQTSSVSDVATDDAVTNDKGSGYIDMAMGTWAADKDPMSQWDRCKYGIQYVNLFLERVEKVKWSPSVDSRNQMFIDRMKGEALGLRAVFYYHLLMAHSGYADDGVLYGVPLLLTAEDGSSDYNQPRETFAKCVKQCIADCDSAIALLPTDYENITDTLQMPEKYRKLRVEVTSYNLVFGTNSQNLMSGKAAEAVRAQVALLAASPAYRDQSLVEPADVVKYCKVVLDRIGGVEGMDTNGHLDWYSSSYKTFIEGQSPEVIWRGDRTDAQSSVEIANYPPTMYGNGRINPSQNLVDVFPMKNGYPITDSRSGFDPKHPYANRDERLKNSIIYNGYVSLRKDTILTGVNMAEGKNKSTDDNLNSIETSTRTGYYLRKTLREDVIAGPSIQGKIHIYPRIRYTEIFLACAEAANDAWGGNADPLNYGYTAYKILKKLRERAGIGVGYDENGNPLTGDKYLEEIKNDKEKMAELIRNERRLELCFENKRFWDLRRWKMPLNETVMGVKIERIEPNNPKSECTYTPIEVESRKFTHKDGSYQWYGPIPRGEVLKWNKLKQNKGWE